MKRESRPLEEVALWGIGEVFHLENSSEMRKRFSGYFQEDAAPEYCPDPLTLRKQVDEPDSADERGPSPLVVVQAYRHGLVRQRLSWKHMAATILRMSRSIRYKDILFKFTYLR
jgi:hypothetical protein